MDVFFRVLELIGSISFAVSGTVTGMRKNFDLFGTIFLGVVTAVGGGVIRDIILGRTLPAVFLDPTCAVAAICASLIFLLSPIRKWINRHALLYERVLFLMDSLGLGIFTAVGASVSLQSFPDAGMYLHVFLGMTTGVGGGLLRDVMASNPPYIFVRHIYALASMAGAAGCALLWLPDNPLPAMLAGIIIVLTLRFLSAHYRWNLPHIHDDYKKPKSSIKKP